MTTKSKQELIKFILDHGYEKNRSINETYDESTAFLTDFCERNDLTCDDMEDLIKEIIQGLNYVTILMERK